MAPPEPAPAVEAEADERVRGIVIPRRTPGSPPPAPVTQEREHLSFTAYYPREVPAETWQTLLVYAHLDTVLAAVRADAARFAPELGERPRTASAPAQVRVERGTALTIVPRCAAVRFNPERVSLSWDEDLHRADFRFRPQAELAGAAATGEITIYAGPLIVAILKFALLVDERAVDEQSPAAHRPATERETALPRAVFASYSHDDTRVVTACRNAYRALGLTVNLDIDSLRSGDYWGPRLMELIDASDIFQLFWSSHAARSPAVRKEWLYALSPMRQRHGSGFIRPVYWEQPLIRPPLELADLHFAYIELPALDTPAP
jgi:hypothetical protein